MTTNSSNVENLTVSLGNDFFANEINKLYGSNWEFAFIREFFQNSIDAGASVINVTLNSDNNTVIFEDNGHGMSEDTFKNIYLKLGRTTKDQNNLGGFGRARILTSFGQVSYKVESTSFSAYGEGIDVKFWQNEENFLGCRFTIVMHYLAKETLSTAIHNILQFSNIDCEVFINGNLIEVTSPEETPVAHNEKYSISNLPKGTSKQTIVRVNGLYSFDVWLNSDTIIDTTKDYVTQTRDSFLSSINYDIRDALNKHKESIRAAQKVTVSNGQDITIFAEEGIALPENAEKIIYSIPATFILGRWKNMIENILSIMHKDGQKPKITVGLGYYASAEATCSQISYGNYELLISSDFLKTGISFEKLAAIAAHEVAHIRESYHDQDYANHLTNIMELLLINYAELKKSDKEMAKMAAAKVRKYIFDRPCDEQAQMFFE